VKTFDAAEVRAALPWPELIDAIGEAVGLDAVTSPDRQTMQVPLPGREDATVLIMPAWEPGAGKCRA
jgi:alanine dehydrogenase